VVREWNAALGAAITRWRTLRTTDLAALNTALRAAGVAEIH